MPFCKNCGNQLTEEASFCSKCGTPVDNAQPQQNYQQAPQQQGFQQQNYQQAPQQPVQPEVMNPDGTVPGAERGVAWLAYVLGAPLFLIPLFVKKESEYCKFHVKQGATLWALHVAYWIVQVFFLAIINVLFPGYRYYGVIVGHSWIYNLFSVLFAFGQIFLCVLMIIGIVYAATGKKKELIIVGKIPWVGMLIDKIYTAINK